MAHANARFIRLGIFSLVLIFCGYILTKGSSSSYTISPGVAPATGSTANDALSSVAEPAQPTAEKAVDNTLSKPKEASDVAAPALGGKERATFVSLARNQDLWELVGSIREIEDRFNSKFHYDWVFLNDGEFSEEFKKVTSSFCSGNTKYGQISKDQWSFPPWIDTDKAAQVREEMREKKIIYGDSISYRHMCRYESGFFFRHPLLEEYDYYWRVEPGIKIYCDVDYDVFKFMRENKKSYGWTISLPEYKETIPTLWKTTKEFIKENPQYIAEDNLMDWISEDGGSSYNGCHFWSNFEVGSLAFWRSEAYLKYFEYLDKAGGFFYERWGDAPVHSIAVALFMPKDQVHFFNDIGYYHVPFHNCPIDEKIRKEKKCMCAPNDDFTFRPYSCTSKFYSLMGLKKPDGWEKYAS